MHLRLSRSNATRVVDISTESLLIAEAHALEPMTNAFTQSLLVVIIVSLGRRIIYLIIKRADPSDGSEVLVTPMLS